MRIFLLFLTLFKANCLFLINLVSLFCLYNQNKVNDSSLSILSLNSLSSLETAISSISLNSYSKGNIWSTESKRLGGIETFELLKSNNFSAVLISWQEKLKITISRSSEVLEIKLLSFLFLIL